MTDIKQNAFDFEEEDFDAIEQAVLETERGRWFLAEYAVRNRKSETTSLLAAIAKLEKAVGNELQHEMNSTIGNQISQELSDELNTLIKAIRLSGEGEVNPVEHLAQKIASNAFTLAHLADTIRDRIDHLEVIDMPADTVIKLGQATQQIISLSGQQSQMSRQVEALAKIIAYVQSRLNSSDPGTNRTGADDFSTALSIASLNKLREKVAALRHEE
jgi:hypothetical protein